MVTSEQLAKLKIGPQWVEPLNETFQRFGLTTIRQQACFIGQCAHECGNFRLLSENLNYRAETLMKLWPKRFPTLGLAQQYAKQPKLIANKVYADRMGNRDEASGDGYRFRGRGCIQTTGSTNYFQAGKALGVDFWADPDLVATPKYAALTAGFFWSTHGLNALADNLDYEKMTKKINGGLIGLEDRKKHIQEAIAVLAG